MRQIHDHKVSGLNEALEINVLDVPGSGGANHTYGITLKREGYSAHVMQVVVFQNGPIKGPEDMNGVTNEAVLAVLIDRMRGFQGLAPVHEKGASVTGNPAPFACRENALALTHLEEALMWLQKRTRDRMARGVEGTNLK